MASESELIPGSGGVFTVCAAGQQIYSKHATGRFPEEEEIVGLLR